MQLEELISGCIAGESNCQESLVRQYAPMLMAVCMRYSRSRENARDALQESFIRILKSIHKYQFKGSFEGWLRRIAIHCAIDFDKKTRKYRSENIDLAMPSKVSIPPVVYSKMEKDEILKLLRQLTDQEYLVFNLAVIEGFDHQEIGEILGIKPSSSRATLARARARLTEILKSIHIRPMVYVKVQ